MEILSIRAINQKAERLYELMLQDMELCRRKQLAIEVELECLFKINNRYRAILQDEVMNHEFEDEAEEIHFFKGIKPKFLAEQIYSGLQKRARVFKENGGGANALEEFRRWEFLRLGKFQIAFAEFYEYYKAGRTDKDFAWFTRIGKFGDHGLDRPGNSMQDHLVSQLIALERYAEYLRKL